MPGIGAIGSGGPPDCEPADGVLAAPAAASPVVGAGVPVSRIHQLFLLALQHGKKSEAEQAAFAWGLLSGEGQRVVKNGKALETPEENLAELANTARQFTATQLSVLRALKIAS